MMHLSSDTIRVAVLHGAGYVGGELVRLLLAHPSAEIAAVTSRHFAGQPVSAAHSALRGVTPLGFTDPTDLAVSDIDVAFVCAEHGQGAAAVAGLRDAGFDGLVVDLSADHRLSEDAVYGLAEVHAAETAGTNLVANPGCFATGLGLSLWPLAQHLGDFEAHVTALTGASGSGARPSATTHFPARDGNVRAYKVLAHQHLAEVQSVLGAGAAVHFVPTSGPWTRGIWGTGHVTLPDAVSIEDVTGWFEQAYGDKTFVRFDADTLPELLPVVGTPFCDIGLVEKDGHLVIGFALDNLLKGAASQAVQNFNLALGLPEAAGLLPGVAVSTPVMP